MDAQLSAFLKKQNAGRRKLLGQGCDTKFCLGGIGSIPFFIGKSIALFKYNPPVDANEH